MNLQFKLIIGSFFSFLSSEIRSQELTTKDFKLLIDDRTFPDSTITISELLQLKKVTTNFLWITFKELAIYIEFKTIEEYKSSIYDKNTVTICNGTYICDSARSLFKKLRPGNYVTFQASEAPSKSGNKLLVQDLTLRVK